MVEGTALVDRFVALERSDPVQHTLVDAALAWALCGLVRPAPVSALLVLAQDDTVPQLRQEDGHPVPPDHPEVRAALAAAAAPEAGCPPLLGLTRAADGEEAVLPAAALVEAGRDRHVRQRTFHRLHRLVAVEELVPVGQAAAREGFWYTAETLLEDAVELRIEDAYVAIADVYDRQGFYSTGDLWMERMKREATVSLAELRARRDREGDRR